MGAGALRMGLTGGIGSGKSTAAAALQALGAALVDTDAIARELTADDNKCCALGQDSQTGGPATGA